MEWKCLCVPSSVDQLIEQTTRAGHLDTADLSSAPGKYLVKYLSIVTLGKKKKACTFLNHSVKKVFCRVSDGNT